jgi:hypothetical protein
MTTDRLDRNDHCTHPEQAWCDCDWCRYLRTVASTEPEPTPMDPPTPHTLHCIRARACGAYGFYAQLSDSSVESFGVEWLMSGLREIHATYLAEMAAVGCDQHGGFTGGAR